MNPNLTAPPTTETNGNVEGLVKHVIYSAEKSGNHLEIILCIMPLQDNKHLYATVKRIARLLRAGMNVACFNFSHGSHEYHQETFDNLRTAMYNT
jgi:pyruvate kinase